MIFSYKYHFVNSYKNYKKGFAFGYFPVFFDCETTNCGRNFRDIDFKNGFTDGRFVYEELNGKISGQLPEEILTIEVVYSIYVDGLLNNVSKTSTKYNLHQQNIVKFYYELGKIDADENASLKHILEQLQITTL